MVPKWGFFFEVFYDYNLIFQAHQNMLQFCHVYCENSHVYSGFSSSRIIELIRDAMRVKITLKCIIIRTRVDNKNSHILVAFFWRLILPLENAF